MDYYSQLNWVNEYIRNVSPYIYVREEDNLLIKIPNEVHKLNPSAVKILKKLVSGENIFSIVDSYPDRQKVAYDIHNFFCDLRALLRGCYHESSERRTIEKIPFSLQFNTLPVLSEVAVTYDCNLSCKFCYAGCTCRKTPNTPQLDTASLKEVLGIIKNEAKVPSVSFTGGEPALRSDLIELVSHAHSLSFWTNLITNATLITKDLARKLKNAGLNSAQVSLEAPDESLNDYIVQEKGAFKKTIAGLVNLKEAAIRVHTNTTINRLNKDEAVKIPGFLKSLGMDKFSMNMLMPAGSALSNLEEVLVRYSEIGDIVLGVQRESQSLGLEFMWYSPTPICIFNPIIHGLGNKGCAACDGLLSIAPNADILPCSSYPKAMANILKIKNNFRKVWQSKSFIFFQKKHFAHKKCRQCEHLAVCNGGCPLYWQELGYGEILSKEEVLL